MTLGAPTIAGDVAAGIPVVRRPYGMTEKDVEETLRHVAIQIREGGRTPSIRAMAGQALQAAGYPQGVRATTQCLLDYVRSRVGYVGDPPLVEMVQSAKVTLCTPDARLCIPIGDCDDLVVALGAMLLSVGIETFCLVQDYGPQQEMHILLVVKDESGRMLAADPSKRYAPVGPKDSAIKEIWMDPTNPEDLRINSPPGEFVGIGRPKYLSDIDAITARKKPCCSACAQGKPCTGCGSKVHPCSCETGKTLARRPMFNSMGAAPGTATGPDFTATLVDINQMALNIQDGDGYAKGPTPSLASALQSYKAAGQLGATRIGPEIDAAGASQITQPYTQQAWQLNSALAAIDLVGDASDTNAVQIAGNLAKSMLLLYQSAIAAVKNPLTIAKEPTPNKSGLALAVGFAVAGGVAWAAWKNRRAIGRWAHG